MVSRKRYKSKKNKKSRSKGLRPKKVNKRNKVKRNDGGGTVKLTTGNILINHDELPTIKERDNNNVLIFIIFTYVNTKSYIPQFKTNINQIKKMLETYRSIQNIILFEDSNEVDIRKELNSRRSFLNNKNIFLFILGHGSSTKDGSLILMTESNDITSFFPQMLIKDVFSGLNINFFCFFDTCRNEQMLLSDEFEEIVVENAKENKYDTTSLLNIVPIDKYCLITFSTENLLPSYSDILLYQLLGKNLSFEEKDNWSIIQCIIAYEDEISTILRYFIKYKEFISKYITLTIKNIKVDIESSETRIKELKLKLVTEKEEIDLLNERKTLLEKENEILKNYIDESKIKAKKESNEGFFSLFTKVVVYGNTVKDRNEIVQKILQIKKNEAEILNLQEIMKTQIKTLSLTEIKINKEISVKDKINYYLNNVVKLFPVFYLKQPNNDKIVEF